MTTPGPPPVLAQVIMPDDSVRDVHTQAELDTLVREHGAEPAGDEWRPRATRTERRAAARRHARAARRTS